MNVLRKLTKYEIKIHARSTPFGIFLSRLAADGSITRKGENERGNEGREETKKGELLQSQGTCRILYRTIQVRSTREEEEGGRKNLTLRLARSIFNEKNSTRFVSSVIRFVFNLGLIVLSEKGEGERLRRFDLRES